MIFVYDSRIQHVIRWNKRHSYRVLHVFCGYFETRHRKSWNEMRYSIRLSGICVIFILYYTCFANILKPARIWISVTIILYYTCVSNMLRPGMGRMNLKIISFYTRLAGILKAEIGKNCGEIIAPACLYNSWPRAQIESCLWLDQFAFLWPLVLTFCFSLTYIRPTPPKVVLTHLLLYPNQT